MLIRAARHYEGAMQILIRHAVMSGRQVWIFLFLNITVKLFARYTGLKHLSFRPKFYGKTKVKWALFNPDHCFRFGKQ